jgi:ketosteroid isomerase-like protein
VVGAAGNPGTSESPIDVVRRAYDVFRRRDLDALTAMSHPEITISSVTGVVAGREEPYRGVGALAQYLEDVERIWDEIELLPQEFTETEDGRVLVFGRVRARRGKSRIDTPNAWMWELREGRVVAVHVYAEPSRDARWLFRRD